MSDKRIVVPEGMLRVACRAYQNPSFDWADDEHYGVFTRPVLEAALRWWTENGPPLMKRFNFNPHDGEQGMEEEVDGDYVLYADICRMFLASEQEEPKFTESQIAEAIRKSYNGGDYDPYVVWRKVQVNLGLFPASEIPEEIKDLLANTTNADLVESQVKHHEWINRQILEAYRRGKAGK